MGEIRAFRASVRPYPFERERMFATPRKLSSTTDTHRRRHARRDRTLRRRPAAPRRDGPRGRLGARCRRRHPLEANEAHAEIDHHFELEQHYA